VIKLAPRQPGNDPELTPIPAITKHMDRSPSIGPRPLGHKRKDPGDLSGTLVGLEVTITSDFASFRADSLACS
jgi:hypothetical protein